MPQTTARKARSPLHPRAPSKPLDCHSPPSGSSLWEFPEAVWPRLPERLPLIELCMVLAKPAVLQAAAVSSPRSPQSDSCKEIARAPPVDRYSAGSTQTDASPVTWKAAADARASIPPQMAARLLPLGLARSNNCESCFPTHRGFPPALRPKNSAQDNS